MRRVVVFILVFAVLLVMAIPVAFAAPPCNDTNGDGASSGYEYAQYHIKPLAQDGLLGNGGHKPGVGHRGFSVCL